MRYILPLLLLSACAHDNYTPADSGMRDTLSACKHEASKAYNSGKADYGVLAGAAGVLGGGIGGAIVGAAQGMSSTDNSMKLSDINPYIEKCMKKHGYTGTSEN